MGSYRIRESPRHYRVHHFVRLLSTGLPSRTASILVMPFLPPPPSISYPIAPVAPDVIANDDPFTAHSNGLGRQEMGHGPAGPSRHNNNGNGGRNGLNSFEKTPGNQGQEYALLPVILAVGGLTITGITRMTSLIPFNLFRPQILTPASIHHPTVPTSPSQLLH